mmetsp:Transcript_6958/g.6921  ORF Transcript_6958/g.6921 Transcript_6958/m.6921 type:complete len:596 (+) Transcript_6958:237-2024(+)
MSSGPYPQGVPTTHRDIPLNFSFASKGSTELLTSNKSSDRLKCEQQAGAGSGSTKSESFSIPYNPTDNTNSLDTASLLNQFENKDPLYSNTSHINMVHTPVKQHFSNPNTPVRGQIDENLFNQVPKRFSQFIIDQQVPNDVHKLDNLTLDSISIYSMERPELKKTEALRLSNSNRISGENNHAQVNRSVSTTGSQSTIFSTRQEKRRLFKLAKSKSNGPNLSRSKAIRFKQGSWYYRLKVRMRKFAKKLRALRFNNFTAASKRTGSIKRSKTRGKTLKRKYRKNPQNAAVKRLTSKEISVPYSNPRLGKGETERVETLDAILKQQAGATRENNVANNIKQNQISGYIDEQQDSYINSMYTKTKSSSINYGNNAIHRKSIKHYNSTSDIEEVPPTPPPHLEHNNFSTVEGEKANDVIGAWKRYLSHVISQRIQLRQEIVFFQTLAASNDAKYMIDDEGTSKADTNADDDSKSEFEFVSESEGSLAKYISETETLSSSEIRSESDIMDLPTQEFNKAYNRRSMLGEMLDYDSSDNELVSSSVYSDSSHASAIRYENFIRSASSTASSDLGIGKRYGTILRRNTTMSRNVQIRNQHLV